MEASWCRLSHAATMERSSVSNLHFMGHGCINKSSAIGQSSWGEFFWHSARPIATIIEPFRLTARRTKLLLGIDSKQVVEIIKNKKNQLAPLLQTFGRLYFVFCLRRRQFAQKNCTALNSLILWNRQFIFANLMMGVVISLIFHLHPRDFSLRSI